MVTVWSVRRGTVRSALWTEGAIWGFIGFGRAYDLIACTLFGLVLLSGVSGADAATGVADPAANNGGGGGGIGV